MKNNISCYFYLFVSFLFLGICSVNLFSDGMFLDGLLYADISRNMAEGLGSFWTPHLSNGLFDEFYEHPPLALGLESIFFRIFGDSIYVERFYSLFTFIIVGFLIVLIWEKLTQDRKTGWIPILLWVIIPEVTWAASNNMLENTMTIFVCLSVLLYLSYLEKKNFIYIIFAGISLSLGLLSKGFFCLYIWSMPLFVWMFRRNISLYKMVFDTFVLIIATIIPIVLLYACIPEAQSNMFTYFNKQVIGSIQNVKTVDTRFAIVGEFLESVIVPIIISIIIIIVALRNKVEKSIFKTNINIGLLFLCVTLSGVLPIMISMKQRGFYILSVYPLFAIGLAYFIYPILEIALNNWQIKYFKVLKITTYSIMLISVGLSVSQINRIGRDKEMINDCKTVISVVGEDTTINIAPQMYSIWSLHGYFSRYGNVSLDKNENNICKYYLCPKGSEIKNANKQYENVPIDLKRYTLYKTID